MGIGLIADLAVGADCAGSQAWSRQDELLPRVTVGAPPDVTDAEAFKDVLLDALQQTVPAVIQIPIDYSDNIKLMQDIHQSFVH